MEKIEFQMENGEAPVQFFVLEQTVIAGISYLLVSDSAEDDAEALILKDLSAPEDEESIYEIVDDDEELDAVAAVFANMLDDVEFTREDR